MIPSTLRNFTLFADGRGMAGNVLECVLPKLTLKTEEHMPGGMDAPVELDMGMDVLTTEYTLSSHHPAVLGLFGSNNIPLTMRGAEQDENGIVVPIICKVRGLQKEADPGTWKKGDKAEVKLINSLRYYQLTVGGDVVHEIDVENMTRIIGGVDQLAAQRAALGI